MASSLRLPERAALGISIAGESVTSEFKPFLITVSATDKDNAGGEIDECLIELDDSYGQLRLPGTGDPISINMGWRGGVVRNVFTGVVSDVESGFSKNEGRRLFIQGKGADPLGLGKQQFKQDWGTGETDVPLSKVMEEAAGVAGYEIVIAKELAALTRKYWSQNRESFWNLGHRLARELGGTFKIAGNMASLSSATEQVNALGAAMGIVRATWGDNMLQWRIRPIVGRPILDKVISEFFDPENAAWKTASKEVPGFRPFLGKAEHMVRWATGQDAADQVLMGPSADSERKRAQGWVLTDGEPSARAGGTVVVSGARPGVDGSYRITEAEHTWGRDSGYVTRMNLENPAQDVGIDGRPDWQAG